MAERCSWERGCDQDRAGDRYCYYHSKLVAGQVSAAERSRSPELAHDLAHEGASEAVVEAAKPDPAKWARLRRYDGRGIRRGVLRVPEES